MSSSLFPAPPFHYKLFTTRNILWRDAQEDELVKFEESRPNKELAILRSQLQPPPPIQGTYTMFGSNAKTESKRSTLADFGIQELSITSDGDLECLLEKDRKAELRRLTMSAVFSYMNLIDTLIQHPSKFEEQVDMIKTIFLNLHHLLGDFRPHQARETLRLLFEQQSADTQLQISHLKTCCEQVRNLCIDIASDPAFHPHFSGKEEDKEDLIRAETQSPIAVDILSFESFIDLHEEQKKIQLSLQQQLDML